VIQGKIVVHDVVGVDELQVVVEERPVSPRPGPFLQPEHDDFTVFLEVSLQLLQVHETSRSRSNPLANSRMSERSGPFQRPMREEL
jgi:hypothetical protein